MLQREDANRTNGSGARRCARAHYLAVHWFRCVRTPHLASPPGAHPTDQHFGFTLCHSSHYIRDDGEAGS